MTLYADDGSINVTIVNYSPFGLHMPDGSYAAVIATGTSPVGLYHYSGAYWVTETSTGPTPFYAPDGSRYILATPNGQGTPVTVVATISYMEPQSLVNNINIFKAATIATV